MLVGCLAVPAALSAQEPVDFPEGLPAIAAVSAAPAVPTTPFNQERIFGIIPDYQTVNSNREVAPLTRKQKWVLALKEVTDPFNAASAVMAAGFSQAGNQTPKYGEGGDAYAERLGAALADFGTQSVFSAGVLATLLHQDPRYFRKGTPSGIPSRVAYSVSRVFVARQDSGRAAFNASGIFGMAMGIAASNLYYPAASITGRVMLCRVETSLFGGVTGNLMSEFWPDVRKLLHRKFTRI